MVLQPLGVKAEHLGCMEMRQKGFAEQWLRLWLEAEVDPAQLADHVGVEPTRAAQSPAETATSMLAGARRIAVQPGELLGLTFVDVGGMG